MKRLLFCLGPWMAMAATAAAQDEPKPAEAAFCHLGQSFEAWQIGRECYVPLSALASAGWGFRVDGSRVKVFVEGKELDVPLSTQARQPVVPLSVLCQKIGAGMSWAANGKAEIWSPLRFVKATEDAIEFESPLPVRAQISYLTNPPRVVVDVIGARIGDRTPYEMSSCSRMSQFKPNVVRIVAGTAGKPDLMSGQTTGTKSFKLPLDGSFSPPQIDEPPKQTPFAIVKSQTPKSDTGAAVQTFDPILNAWTGREPDSLPFDFEPPVWNGAPLVIAGPFNVLDANRGSVQLTVAVSRSLTLPPRFQRPEPSTLEIVLPGAAWDPSKGLDIRAPYIEAVEAVAGRGELLLRLKLTRPMGIQLTSVPGGIHVGLIKPNVGDGKLAGKVVVVDAGHGGEDSGARSPDKRVQEKNLTLKVASLVAARLSEQGATVIMTRKTDVRIPLKERSEIANRNGAHFFVSVHVNSTPYSNKTSGGITFFHNQDPICMLLADCIQGELAKVGGIPNMGTWSDTRIYDSGFAVLRYSRMPAVLVELGFINHWRDRRRILERDFQEAAAKAIVQGIRVYLGDGKTQKE